MRILFTRPIYLWLFLLRPLLLVLANLFKFKKKQPIALKFSNFETLQKLSKKPFLSYYKGFITKRYLSLSFFRIITLSFFILAISGPIIEYSGSVSNFDFVLAIDSSSSMIADDFKPNRLEASKEAALLFAGSVAKQTNIGVVSFAGDVFTNLRPTNKIRKVKSTIRDINIAETGGTNIGDALISSANIFENANPKRIILLTDGQANMGPEPIDALDYVNSKNITVHTIGVATKEGGKVSIGFVSKLDEETLKTIAEQTNGKYYKAEDKEFLETIFKEIASSTVKKAQLDFSWISLVIGLIALIGGWFLVIVKYRVLP